MTDRWRQGLVAWTLPQLRQSAKRRAARLDARSFANRRRSAAKRRQVRCRSTGNGISTISIDLPDDVAAQVMTRIDDLTTHCLAGRNRDPYQSLHATRADVVVDLILQPAAGPPTAATGYRDVAVVISAAALLGLTDEPAELPDGTPIPADIARELAADRRWRLWITAADGHVVATSPTTYRPGAALVRLIRAREPHCRMPGCRYRPTDLDHTTSFPSSPGTTAQNLGSLCRRHHNLKTTGGWRLTNNPAPQGGTSGYTWTTPAGITYADRTRAPLRH